MLVSELRISILPLLKYFCGLWRHTVDAPVRLSVPVADGDGEPSEVRADDADLTVKAGTVAVLARDGHVLALAPVVRLVQGAVGSST